MRYKIIDKENNIVFPDGHIEGVGFEFDEGYGGLSEDQTAELVRLNQIVVTKARGRSETTKEDKGKDARRK